MTAIGFVLILSGMAMAKVADELDLPDFVDVSGAVVFLFGCLIFVGGISIALWRFMP